ncbi:hypothetical protein NE237_008143 [Protea cynaroides]|uniref:Uncharacterized protein n=1 Tax=Protea cynaroides TaxID=273540 RepID=A0A9Q0QX52_9MAGN|nr:hypothetical protein NE237_008143 [Protea cynaroides]
MPAHRVLSRSLERRDIPLGGGLARSYGAIVVGSNVDPISHVRLPDFRGTSLVVGAIKVMGAMLVPPEATVRARMDVGDARMEGPQRLDLGSGSEAATAGNLNIAAVMVGNTYLAPPMAGNQNTFLALASLPDDQDTKGLFDKTLTLRFLLLVQISTPTSKYSRV